MKSKLGRLIKNQRVLTFAEQGLLSGTNFFVFLIGARTLDKHEWGLFSFAFAIILFLQGFQRASVLVPMVSFTGTCQSFLSEGRYWFIKQKEVTVKLALFLIFVSCFLYTFPIESISWAPKAILLALLVLVPVTYFEFFRRWLLMERQYTLLLLMTAAYSLSYLSLVIFGLDYFVSSLHFILALFISSAIGAVFGWYIRSKSESLSKEKEKNRALELKIFRREASYSHIAFSCYTSLVQICLGIVSGPSALAVLSATRILVQPIQTMIAAIDGIDKPRASAAWHAAGFVGLKSSLTKTLITLLIFGGTYLVAILIWGDGLLHLLYDGKYDDSVFELYMWIFIALLMLLAQPAESALYVVRKTKFLLIGRLCAAFLAAVVAFIMIPEHGSLGALAAIATGWFVSTLMAYAHVRKIR